MNDGVDSFGSLHHGRCVRKFECQRFLVGADVLYRNAVSKAQRVCKMRKPFAQLGAEPSGRAGDEDGLEGFCHGILEVLS